MKCELLLLLVPLSLSGQHVLRVTPSTVQWGYFAADAKPVLTVKSGETGDHRHHLRDSRDAGAARRGAPTTPIREMKEMYAKVKDKGPGSALSHRPGGHRGRHAGRCARGGNPGYPPALALRLDDDRSPTPALCRRSFPICGEKLVRLDEQNKLAEFAPGSPDSDPAVFRQSGRRASVRPPEQRAAGLQRRQPRQQVAGGGHQGLHSGASARERCSRSATDTRPRATAKCA